MTLLGPFAPFRGGIAQFNDRLRAELELQGHEVQAVSFSRQYPDLLFPGTTQFDPSREGTALRVIDSLNPLSWRRAGRLIRDFRPDRVIVAYWTPHLAPALAGTLRATGGSAVGLVHNARPHENSLLASPLARLVLGRCASVVTLSESVARDVRDLGFSGALATFEHPVYDHFGQPPERASARRALDLDAQGPVLLCLGLVRPYKGFDVALEAFAAIRAAHPSATLIIAGEAYDDALDGLLNDGRHIGVRRENRYIPDAELPRYYAAADALLLPYRSGTQSGALAAAAHFGLPVVVTPVPGLAEPVRTFAMGQVASGHDPAQFGEAVLAALQPDQLVQASHGARNMARTRSWATFTRNLLAA
ncbi:MAG: glycosyltransferase [Rhodothermales bacterium]|nr:glycosyltransferase [Rhodothermales bacterium]